MRKLAVILAAVLGSWPVAAQTAATSRPAFGETVDVQLVHVEVWGTDRQGNPVTGLGMEEVREDGKPAAISNFAEVRPVDLHRPAGTGASPPPAG